MSCVQYVKVGGVWRFVEGGVYVKAAGAWNLALRTYRKEAGLWVDMGCYKETAFIGPNIGDIVLTVDVPMAAQDYSTRFEGTILGYTLAGAWPPGLVIDSEGVVSGTPLVSGAYTGLRVEAWSTLGIATSNEFNISVV